MPNSGLLERFFLDFEAYLYPEDLFRPKDGCFIVPDKPGLGIDPDKNVIKDYLIRG